MGLQLELPEVCEYSYDLNTFQKQVKNRNGQMGCIKFIFFHSIDVDQRVLLLVSGADSGQLVEESNVTPQKFQNLCNNFVLF